MQPSQPCPDRVAAGFFSKLLAHFGKDEEPESVRVSQETLARMIGTTRPRVTFFMNKFRRLGFIDYKKGLRVYPSLLTMILRD